MNTPPPDSDFIKPEPLPSMSTSALPLQITIPVSTNRPRRHTITRPDSALALLSDSDDGDNNNGDQTLDRISDILSNLLQEANEAVQNNCTSSFYTHARQQQQRRPRSAFISTSQSATTIQRNNTNIRPKSSISISRLPRPTRQFNRRVYHHERNSSISSAASSASLFSPIPNVESPITASSMDNLLLQSHQLNDPLFKKSTSSLTSTSTTSLHSNNHYENDNNDDQDNNNNNENNHENNENNEIDIEKDNDHHHHQQKCNNEILKSFSDKLDDPLLESFRRLDSSMAMVESLSRDLEEEFEHHHDNDNNRNTNLNNNNNSFINSTTSTSKLTLLLLPLLHIPHAILTTVFDHLTSNHNNNNIPTTSNLIITPSSSSSFSSNINTTLDSSSTFSGMLAWAFFFAMANMVITWSGVNVPRWFLNKQYQQGVNIKEKEEYIRSRRFSLPGSYKIELDDDFTSFYTSSNGKTMIRSKRPTPINTNLTIKKSSTFSTRKTPIKRSHPSSSTSSRRRTASHQHHHHKTHHLSNEKSYTMAIQQSRKYFQLSQKQELIEDSNNHTKTLITLRRRCSI